MIQGPSEFAEGLGLGVKSLFGHTVGGAAGAFGRITGTLGKINTIVINLFRLDKLIRSPIEKVN